MNRELKKEDIYLVGFSIMIITLVIGVGVLLLRDVAEIPFKLCEDKTGLITNLEEGYIWYDCDKVNNITVSLNMGNISNLKH